MPRRNPDDLVFSSFIRVGSGLLRGPRNRSDWALPLIVAGFVLVLGSQHSQASPDCDPGEIFAGQNEAYSVGSQPLGVALGDFDRDGDLDAVVANASDDDIIILLNNGLGVFAEQHRYPSGDGPTGVAVGDLNGDGDPDIAVANNGYSRNVRVFINSEDGEFNSSFAIDIGSSYVHKVKIGDIDNDGWSDLVVSTTGPQIAIIMNSGEGFFSDPVLLSVNTRISEIELEDLDSDGFLDIALAGQHVNPGVYVIYNDRNGGFLIPSRYTTGDWPTGIDLGDIDNDGDVDIVSGEVLSASVFLISNNGNRTFEVGMQYDAGIGVLFGDSIRLGDCDRDGNLDICVAIFDDGFGGDDYVSLLFGDGLGGFSLVQQFGVGDGPQGIALADLNGDASLDLAVLNLHNETLSVLLNQCVVPPISPDPCLSCTGPFEYSDEGLYTVGALPRGVAAGDVTGDGVPDLAVASVSGDLTVMHGAGDGSFLPQAPLDAGHGPFTVAMGDLDGDDDLDLAVGNYYSDDVSVLLNTGGGVFAAQVAYPAGDSPVQVALGDLDGDGDLDIGVANRDSDDVSILLNSGNGTFAPQARFAAGDEPFGLGFGDIDGDGDLDLGVANGTSDDLSVLVNDGAGSFSGEARYPAGDRPWQATFADLDGDGDNDLVAVSGRSDDASVLLNNGDGTFAPQVRYIIGDEPRTLVVADLDADGDLDLACANPGVDDDVGVLLNNGDGTFASRLSFPAGVGAAGLAVADFEGDGDLDMAVANYDEASLSVLLSSCTPRCVEQWAVDEGGNGHWYGVRLVPAGLTWTAAKSLATAAGGHLATLTSLGESDWLFSTLVDDPAYWNTWRGPFLGGYKPPGFPVPADGWVWVTGEPWSFTAWFPGEPNNSGVGESVLHYMSTADGTPVPEPTWNDTSIASSDRVAYVIEWSADCNNDGLVDYGQILSGELEDADGNGVPDICVVCLADLNDDGLLDLSDLTAFVGAFILQRPEADINGDGLFDLADIIGFVDAFNAGCP